MQKLVLVVVCGYAAAFSPKPAASVRHPVARPATAYLETLSAPVVDDSTVAVVDVTAAYLNSLAAAPASLKSARPAINEVLKARLDPVADAKQRLLAACDLFEASQRAAAAAAAVSYTHLTLPTKA